MRFVLALIVLLLITPTSALAHGDLKSSAPTANRWNQQAYQRHSARRPRRHPAGQSRCGLAPAGDASRFDRDALEAWFDAESPVYAAIRALLYLGLMMTIGAVVFQRCVLRGLRDRRDDKSLMLGAARHHAARIGILGAMIIAVGAKLRFAACPLRCTRRARRSTRCLCVP